MSNQVGGAAMGEEEADDVMYIKTEREDSRDETNKQGRKRKCLQDTPVKQRSWPDRNEEAIKLQRLSRRLIVDMGDDHMEDGEKKKTSRCSDTTSADVGGHFISLQGRILNSSASDDGGYEAGEGGGDENFHDTQSTTHDHETFSQSDVSSNDHDGQEFDEEMPDESQQSSGAGLSDIARSENSGSRRVRTPVEPLGQEVVSSSACRKEERPAVDVHELKQENERLRRQVDELKANVKDLKSKYDRLWSIVQQTMETLTDTSGAQGEPGNQDQDIAP
eukprot:745690-Hanusia_phi.AAC.4